MRILVSGSLDMVRDLVPAYPDNLGYIVTPKNANLPGVCAGGLPFALDNGCFHERGFDPAAFRGCLERVAGNSRLLWIVCPDVVASAIKTLGLFQEWFQEVEAAGPVAFVAQDGQQDLPVPWCHFSCLFIGGSTRWKLSHHAFQLADEARRRKKLVHMGRVNSMQRLRVAYSWGCDSVDGSSYSKWACRAAVARPDMALERHLRYLAGLERQATEQATAW